MSCTPSRSQRRAVHSIKQLQTPFRACHRVFLSLSLAPLRQHIATDSDRAVIGWPFPERRTSCAVSSSLIKFKFNPPFPRGNYGFLSCGFRIHNFRTTSCGGMCMCVCICLGVCWAVGLRLLFNGPLQIRPLYRYRCRYSPKRNHPARPTDGRCKYQYCTTRPCVLLPPPSSPNPTGPLDELSCNSLKLNPI